MKLVRKCRFEFHFLDEFLETFAGNVHYLVNNVICGIFHRKKSEIKFLETH